MQETRLVSFASTTRRVADEIAQLEQIKEEIANLPTEVLADGYAQIKPFENTVKQVTEAIRKEFINRTDSGGFEGRFFREDTPVTKDPKKGHLVYETPSGTKLQARRSVRVTVDEEAALDYLREKGIVEQGTDVTYTVKNPNAMRKLLMFLHEVLDEEQKVEFMEHWREALEEKITPNVEKLEALVKIGIIPPEDIEQFMHETENYALYILK